MPILDNRPGVLRVQVTKHRNRDGCIYVTLPGNECLSALMVVVTKQFPNPAQKNALVIVIWIPTRALSLKTRTLLVVEHLNTRHGVPFFAKRRRRSCLMLKYCRNCHPGPHDCLFPRRRLFCSCAIFVWFCFCFGL